MLLAKQYIMRFILVTKGKAYWFSCQMTNIIGNDDKIHYSHGFPFLVNSGSLIAVGLRFKHEIIYASEVHE